MAASSPQFFDDGYTSIVHVVPNSSLVRKSFLPKCIPTHFPVELEAYTRFQSRPDRPSSILAFHGIAPDDPAGLLLDFAPRGTVYRYLWSSHHLHLDPIPPPSLLYRWASQAAEALSFAHSCGVLNSDIYCSNFLLDTDLNLIVADWAGASIDGGKSHSSYRLTHTMFRPTADGSGSRVKISVETEVFALGCAIYHMVSGRDLFEPELNFRSDREVIRRLGAREMPETRGLAVLGEVVERCWRTQFKSMDEAREAIEEERRIFETRSPR